MDYLSLFVCCVCAVSVSELLVTPNNLKTVLHPPADRIIKYRFYKTVQQRFHFRFCWFRNGTIYDTSGGYAATAATSFALVQDWKVPLAESLIVSPDDLCDSSSACGPTEAFDCTDVRRMLEMSDSSDVDNNRRLTNIDITCSETDCSNISVQLLKEACERDIALTNDTLWACEPSKVNPIIVVPGSNDFVPHPSDAATGQSGGGTYSGFSSFLKSFSCL